MTQTTIKAVIRNPQENARNYSNEKELVSHWSVIGKIKGELREVVTVKCYMGRSTNASTVYASLWVHVAGFYCSGKGSAGGYGYHKESAAVGEAIASAGIELYGKACGIPQYDYNEKRAYTEEEQKAMLRKAMKERCHINGVGDSAIEDAIKAIAKAAGAKGKLLVIRG